MKDRQDRIVTYQARWDKKTEPMRKKLNDNNIKLASVPSDVIVCKQKKNDEMQAASLVISDIRLMHIVFPVLKDVPIKPRKAEFGDGYVINQLVEVYGQADSKPSEAFNAIKIDVPLSEGIDQDDLIIRVFIDSPKQSTIVVYKVANLLGDMSNNSVLSVKAVLVPVSEDQLILKDERLKKAIQSIAKRRLATGY